MEVDTTFYYAWAIHAFRSQCNNAFLLVEEIYVDQTKEGQIKTYKMEQVL